MTLRQACLPDYQKAQCAFKDLMIHGILQFTLLIAFCCVLHRCQNQEIRCWKFYLLIKVIKIRLKTTNYWITKCLKWSLGRRRSTLPKQLSNYNKGWREERSTHPRRVCKPYLLSNDPSAGSPTETLLRLLLPLNDQVWQTSQPRVVVANIPRPVGMPHLAIQSVVATGGVYKGQGRNQRMLMTCAY